MKTHIPLFILFTSLTACSPPQKSEPESTVQDIKSICPGDPKAQRTCINKIQESVNQLSEKSAAISQRYAEISTLQGKHLMHNGNTHKAQKAFKDAISIQPAFIDAHIGLGAACYELNDLICALNELKTAKALSKTQKINEGTRQDLNTLHNILSRHQI